MIVSLFFSLSFSEYRTLMSPPGTPVCSADLFFGLQNLLSDPQITFHDVAPHIWSLWRSAIDSGLSLNETARQLRVLARSGNLDSQIAYGICVKHGEGVPPDDNKAAKYFKLAADQNSAIGHVLFGTHVGVNNSRVGVKHVMTAANMGDPYAQFLAGLILRQKAKNDIMRRQAAELFLSAAFQNHTFAQIAYGICCMFAVGVPRDRFKGAHYFAFASDKAPAGGLFLCGLALWHRGSPDELKLALGFFKDAADKKYAPATTMLGWMIEKGVGCEPDFEAALEMYKIAADMAYPPAQTARDRLVNEPLMPEDDGEYF
jgi:TPR repeat protein